MEVQMKKMERLQAIEMRKEGKSVRAITKELGVSKASVSYWVRDVLLTDEQRVRLEGTRRKGLEGGSVGYKEQSLERRRVYQQQGREVAKHCEQGYAMGCMLFWAEGSKKRNSAVFTNTDGDMVAFFVRFLKKHFGCRVEDFTIRLNAYLDNGKSVEDIERYWSNKLELVRGCIRKSVYKRGDGNGGKYPYGVCSVQVCSGEIAQKLFGSIQELVGIDRREQWANLR
jgi:transposase-like protein